MDKAKIKNQRSYHKENLTFKIEVGWARKSFEG